MALRAIKNPNRGCGTLKAGGTYVRADADGGPSQLEVWSWLLGSGREGQLNYHWKAAPRGVELINLPASIYFNEVITDDTELPDDAADNIKALPRMALLDHVGATFYSPHSFAEETKLYGPSRRIPEPIAKIIAPFVPIPIIFVHSQIPIVDSGRLTDLVDWAQLPLNSEVVIAPTPTFPNWGINDTDWHGNEHWMTDVLKAIHIATKGKQVEPEKFLPATLASAVSMYEQTFGVSWVTSVVNVVPKGGYAAKKMADLYSVGIEPVQISWED